MNQRHFLITCTWDALNVNASQTKILWNSAKIGSNHVFLLEQLKNYQDRTKHHCKKNSMVPWHGRACREMRGEMLRIGQQQGRSNFSKFQVLAWMTIMSKRRSLNQLDNCQKYAHILSWNACTWHELVGQTSYGQWTNLLDPLQNGHKLVTDDWQD